VATRLVRWLGAALVATVVGGCGTSRLSQFYTLDSTAEADGAPSANYGVMVGPVSVPTSVDRPEIVVQVAPNRVEIDQFNRWAAPVAEGIARTVAGDLAALLRTREVATAPFANFDAAYRVTINVQRFDSLPGEAALIDAVWVVRKGGDAKVYRGRTVAREAVRGEGFDALAAAHSRALAKLSADIAAAIRSAADSPT